MPRERLSPLDASFLYLDGEVTCNQGVAYQVAEGPIDFERLVDEMQRKVRYVDRLRQSAVFAPFNLFHPTWEFDLEFDIRNHVKRIVVEPAGDDTQYNETISRIFRTPLDRRHPLWAMYVIDGRADGRSAFLVVIHHCVSDGVGFARIATAFYDADRNLELEPWTPPREGPWPSPVLRVLYGLVDTLCAIPRVISLISRAIAVLLGGFLKPEGRRAWRLLQQFRRAPGVRFAFNAPISGDASFSYAMFRLEDFGSIRAAHGGTINDVLLAMVGTALHRYAVKHGMETEGKFLRLLVPSNVRSMDTKDKLGNFVSMAPVLVPLGEMSTRDRLAATNRVHPRDEGVRPGTYGQPGDRAFPMDVSRRCPISRTEGSRPYKAAEGRHVEETTILQSRGHQRSGVPSAQLCRWARVEGDLRTRAAPGIDRVGLWRDVPRWHAFRHLLGRQNHGARCRGVFRLR